MPRRAQLLDPERHCAHPVHLSWRPQSAVDTGAGELTAGSDKVQPATGPAAHGGREYNGVLSNRRGTPNPLRRVGLKTALLLKAGGRRYPTFPLPLP